MTASGNAQLIEFDASGGSGTIGSGTIEKADTTAYSTARITGDYAFGAAGFDNVNNRAAIEGRFTSNGTGTLTNAAGDVNAYGTEYSMIFTAANYTVSNTATGRGTIHMAFTFGGAPGTLNFVFYVVNSGRLFLLESDVVSSATPLLNGVVVQQLTPSGGFSNSSLSGNMVIYLDGTSICGSGAAGVPKAVAGLLTTSGTGALSLTYDENYCRAPNSVTGAAGTYSVSSNGRTSITIGGYHLVAYLENSNRVFLFVSDANVLFGFGEPQTSSSLSSSVLKGAYAGVATNPTDFGVIVYSGEFTADGAAPTGNIAGAEDIGDPSGPVSGTAFKATYSVAASPTNGRGTMTVSSGTGGNAVIYMISATKFVAISMTDPNPAVLDFESAHAPAPASISLSSLSVSPASVTGGNSATGTVALSGPAPTGGALVTLSSNNGAAHVPASVTVAAGATSATFTFGTSAVAVSTTVVISASHSGVTKTASLTITPAAPPPTLASLSLNPSIILGALQSSSGTVALSRPAPVGGARITLASSNAAASVPSSVTIPAGAISTTFTVNTSIVLLPTSANIAASYEGATKTATLSILL